MFSAGTLFRLSFAKLYYFTIIDMYEIFSSHLFNETSIFLQFYISDDEACSCSQFKPKYLYLKSFFANFLRTVDMN